MKMIKIRTWNEGKEEIHEVKAYLQDGNFAIHRSWYNSEQWAVSCYKIGLVMGTGYDTKKQAIEMLYKNQYEWLDLQKHYLKAGVFDMIDN